MHEIDLRRFDLNLLVVFEVLMFERNVTRAADRLGRTQSAVSHSLSRLRDHGAELISTEVVQYEDSYRLCYIRGPEGLLIGLAQQLQ